MNIDFPATRAAVEEAQEFIVAAEALRAERAQCLAVASTPVDTTKVREAEERYSAACAAQYLGRDADPDALFAELIQVERKVKEEQAMRATAAKAAEMLAADLAPLAPKVAGARRAQQRAMLTDISTYFQAEIDEYRKAIAAAQTAMATAIALASLAHRVAPAGAGLGNYLEQQMRPTREQRIAADEKLETLLAAVEAAGFALDAPQEVEERIGHRDAVAILANALPAEHADAWRRAAGPTPAFVPQKAPQGGVRVCIDGEDVSEGATYRKVVQTVDFNMTAAFAERAGLNEE